MVLKTLWMGSLLASLVALTGCGSDEPDWQFDRADMEAAVYGTWTGTYTPTGGEASALTLDIRSRDELTRSLSCGDRNFSDSDETPGLGVRCIESTMMKVSATLVLDGVSEPDELDGYFRVFGTTLNDGDLDIFYRSANTNLLSASWQNGAWPNCSVTTANPDALLGVCTLDERVE